MDATGKPTGEPTMKNTKSGKPDYAVYSVEGEGG
jgi:hypothetical protein